MATSSQIKKKVLTCSVFTRNGPIVRAMRIDHAEIPVLDGYSSIYLDHCSYIAGVGYGELRIYDENKNLITLYIENGIVEVSQNIIVILVDTALYPKDIDIETTQKEIDKISNQTAINVEESKRNHDKIERLNKKLEVYQSFKMREKS